MTAWGTDVSRECQGAGRCLSWSPRAPAWRQRSASGLFGSRKKVLTVEWESKRRREKSASKGSVIEPATKGVTGSVLWGNSGKRSGTQALEFSLEGRWSFVHQIPVTGWGKLLGVSSPVPWSLWCGHGMCAGASKSLLLFTRREAGEEATNWGKGQILMALASCSLELYSVAGEQYCNIRGKRIV